jgi:acetylglutamate kinase
MDDAAKAAVLIEALPYLQRFRGQTIVIKYGGAAMENPDLVGGVLRDIVFLEAVGINPVIVHGGGKAITRAMEASGLQAQFIDGLRVSDQASMAIIEKTLAETISPGIAQGLMSHGGRAACFPGKDVLRAKKKGHIDSKTGEKVDLGFVGEVIGVDAAPLLEAIRREIVPVISPLARDEKGQVYNINADIAASEVALALKASKAIYLSDVDGVMRNPQQPDTRMAMLAVAQIEELKRDGTITGGMIPKVDSAVKALRNGVKQIHFLDGRVPHALLLEIFTDAGIGTEIHP